MATPGELIAVTANAVGLKSTTVATYYRRLREANLVSKGGRGRSAAKSTPTDAARLIIAIAAAEKAREVDEQTRAMGDLRLAGCALAEGYEDPLEGVDLRVLQTECLEAAVVSVLRVLKSQVGRSVMDLLDPQARPLTLRMAPTERTAEIRCGDEYLEFESRDPSWPSGPSFRMVSEVKIGEAALSEIAHALLD